MSKKSTYYLDYAAATPVDPRVVEAMQPYFSDIFYNPSALYSGARVAKEALGNARHDVAKLLSARPAEIIFTAGGTESCNLAIRGVMEYFPGMELITSSIEHDAVLRPAALYKSSRIAVDSQGIIQLDSLKKLISNKTVLISVMLANNEIGTIQPIKEIVDFVRSVRIARKENGNDLPLYVHTDACQAPLYLDIAVHRLGVDLMTLNGGKIYGPKQSGILYKQAQVKLAPQIVGGGQENGFRSGTENVAFAAGFTRALVLASQGKPQRVKNTTQLRDYFINQLESRFEAELTGSSKMRLANNLHLSFPNSDNERVLFALDDLGVAAAAGSACSASDAGASHVLEAMKKSTAYAQSSIRFSLGKSTTKATVDEVLERLKKALAA